MNTVDTFITIGAFLVYAMGAGVTHAVAGRRRWAHEETTVAITFWPLVLPAFVASRATSAVLNRGKRKELPAAKVVRR